MQSLSPRGPFSPVKFDLRHHCRLKPLLTPFLQVYQLGRAFTALTLQESTVDTAREHGLQVVHAEQALGIFIEPAVQQWFLQRPTLMRWTNKTYSFIHIPGTILYLIVLYHFTTARPRHKLQEEHGGKTLKANWRDHAPQFGPDIYERRRRTMAMCNLLAFIVFTFWPCMPPRLLSDPNYTGEHAAEAKSYGFVDTVHGADGDSSVWTTNRFCNQYGKLAFDTTHVTLIFLSFDTMLTKTPRSRYALPSLWLLLPRRPDRRRRAPAQARPPRLAAPGHRLHRHDLPCHHSDGYRGDGEPLHP